MKVAFDSNVLLRAVVRDDPAQASVAAKILTDAELIAVATPCLCEFVWVLLKIYGFQSSDAATAIHVLLAAANVAVNRPAVEAGLSVLEAGGDFADGVIAYEGNWLGGETFTSFDQKAVAILTAQGQSAHLYESVGAFGCPYKASICTKQPAAKAEKFELPTESPDTRCLGAPYSGFDLKSSFCFGSQ
jgi:predicted nucleic-acid-binding protein